MEKANQDPEDIQQAYRVAYLVAGYLKRSLTEAEQQELEAWVASRDRNRTLFDELTDPSMLRKQAAGMIGADQPGQLTGLDQKIRLARSKKTERIWTCAIVAAAVAVIFIVWVIKPFGPARESPSAATFIAGSNLPLTEGADGPSPTLNTSQKTLVLAEDMEKDTTIDEQVRISGKEIFYSQTSSPAVMHTLALPAASMYRLHLPDGTGVWLNAASSIRYPTRFGNKERKVFLKGEAFFEIAPDKKRPFRVEIPLEDSSSLTVEALGTAFNINAYENAAFLTTTLTKGQVTVTLNQTAAVPLLPGQQFRSDRHQGKVTPADIDCATAWTGNEFFFDNTPITDVLQQLSRWYGNSFQTESLPEIHLNGRFSRQLAISEILRYLSKTGSFRYQIDGQQITITR